MVSDALSALLFGRLFDKLGLKVLVSATALSLLFAPFVFFGNFNLVLAGVVLWGIGMGAQESILRAVIADMAPPGKVASAFGVFNTFFGLSWFVGSALMGLLYDHNILLLVIFSMVSQALSIILYLSSFYVRPCLAKIWILIC
jgi:MFS family permease